VIVHSGVPQDLREVDPNIDVDNRRAIQEQHALAGRLVDAYAGGDSLIRDMLGLKAVA